MPAKEAVANPSKISKDRRIKPTRIIPAAGLGNSLYDQPVRNVSRASKPAKLAHKVKCSGHPLQVFQTKWTRPRQNGRNQLGTSTAWTRTTATDLTSSTTDSVAASCRAGHTDKNCASVARERRTDDGRMTPRSRTVAAQDPRAECLKHGKFDHDIPPTPTKHERGALVSSTEDSPALK